MNKKKKLKNEIEIMKTQKLNTSMELWSVLAFWAMGMMKTIEFLI